MAAEVVGEPPTQQADPAIAEEVEAEAPAAAEAEEEQSGSVVPAEEVCKAAAEEAEEDQEDPFELERQELEAAIAEAKKSVLKMGNAKMKRVCARRLAAGEAAPEGNEELLDAEEGPDKDPPEADDADLQVPGPSREDVREQLARLEAMEDNEDKVQLLLETLGQRVEDARALEEDQVVKNRRLAEATRERDRYMGEVARMNQTKMRLESSCRDLQHKKESIAKENRQIAEEEKSRYQELKDKFEQAMKDVQEKMDAEADVRQHFIKENEELREKLQKFTETYEEQERQREAREQERDVAYTRLEENEAAVAKSKANAAAMEKNNKALRKTTTALRAELQTILDKFDECHESVTCSNQLHSECKVEIDTLQARLQELEKEQANLKSNVEVNNAIEEQKTVQKQRDALEKLCQNLQKEITQLQADVKKGQKGKS